MSAPLETPQIVTLDVDEFPERLGAITVRELRAGLLGRDMVWLLVGVQVVLAIAGIYSVQESLRDPSDALGSMQFAVWSCVIVGLAILSPLRALRALHADRESRLLELLQITSLSAGKIVFGKWLSLAVQTALFLVSLLPFFALRYFLGGADLVGDANILFILFGLCLVTQAVFLLVSTFPRFLRGLALAGLCLALFGMVGSFRAASMFFLPELAHPFRSEGAEAYWIMGYIVALFVCLIGFCLSLAAQMIAAPAENYAGRTRLWVAAWVAVLVCGSELMKNPPKWGESAIVAIVPLAIAAVFELSVERRFLSAHLPRAWYSRLFSWLLLPGWQSAVLFYSILAATLLIVAYACDGFSHALLLAPSAFALVLLPRVIVEFVPWHWFGRRRLACLGLNIVFALLALAVGAMASGGEPHPTWPQFLPPFGFWNGLAWAEADTWSPAPGAIWTGALLILLVVRSLMHLEAQQASARKAGA